MSETYQIGQFSFNDAILTNAQNSQQGENIYQQVIGVFNSGLFVSFRERTKSFVNELLKQNKPLILSGQMIEKMVGAGTENYEIMRVVIDVNMEQRTRVSGLTSDQVNTLDIFMNEHLGGFDSIHVDTVIQVQEQATALETFKVLTQTQSYQEILQRVLSSIGGGEVFRVKCLLCGLITESSEEIEVCPRCGNRDADKFEDV